MDTPLAICKALSDRNRLRIIAALNTHAELCACQLTELLQITGATASRHLGVLINAGLIKSRKEGRWVHYTLRKDNENFAPALQWLTDQFASSADIKADQQALANITACDPEELCRKQRGEQCCPTK